MRLIDADLTLTQAWQNFYKQEDEHEKNIDGYAIMRDRFYEQSGFECCQQTIVNAPTVEAIPKADYENRLKVDMVAMLTDIQLEIEELRLDRPLMSRGYECYGFEDKTPTEIKKECSDIIQQKIDALKEKNEILDLAIKALNIDKVITEIEHIKERDNCTFDCIDAVDEVLDIINKYCKGDTDG